MPQRTCAVEGCPRPHVAKGYCDPHYRRSRATGQPGPLLPTDDRQGQCAFPGCGRRTRSAGLCSAHYLQSFHGQELRPLRPHVDTTARDEQGRKQCSRCTRWLPAEEFRPNKRITGGLHPSCVRCEKSSRLAATYGITIDQYEQMLQEQDGGCAICGGANDEGRRLDVDHDHSCCPGNTSCGKCVRALLCMRCNRAIGLMLDDPERLEAAAMYLRKHRE